MIRINVNVQGPKDFEHLPRPATWMSPTLDQFRRRARVYSPVDTGALRSSISKKEMRFGLGYIVKAGDPGILNPIRGTPTSVYASYQERLRSYMFRARFDAHVLSKLEREANRLFR